MVYVQSAKKTPFTLTGQYLHGELTDDLTLKSIQVRLTQGIQQPIKLAKALRATATLMLKVGMTIEIHGDRNKQGELKARSLSVVLDQTLDRAIDPSSDHPLDLPSPKPQRPPAPEGMILMCQKSKCMRKGGHKVCAKLQQELHDRQLDNTVMVKGTGCMGTCGKPGLVVMPTKARYPHVKAQDISQIIDQNFQHLCTITATA